MGKLRQFLRFQLLKWAKKVAVWGLTKLAVAGIDEADGALLGKEIRTRLPEPVWKAVDGYLGEIRTGLRA